MAKEEEAAHLALSDAEHVDLELGPQRILIGEQHRADPAGTAASDSGRRSARLEGHTLLPVVDALPRWWCAHLECRPEARVQPAPRPRVSVEVTATASAHLSPVLPPAAAPEPLTGK